MPSTVAPARSGSGPAVLRAQHPQSDGVRHTLERLPGLVRQLPPDVGADVTHAHAGVENLVLAVRTHVGEVMVEQSEGTGDVAVQEGLPVASRTRWVQGELGNIDAHRRRALAHVTGKFVRHE